MKKIAGLGLATVMACAAMFGVGGAAATASDARPSATASEVAQSQPAQASLQEAFAYIRENSTPVAVRETNEGTEFDYAFGEGSVLTILEPRESVVVEDGLVSPMVSVGADDLGYYIQFTPADQETIVAGGTTAFLGLVGALGGPIGAVGGAALAAAIVPQINSATCGANGQDARFYYTLDGAVQDVRCV